MNQKMNVWFYIFCVSCFGFALEALAEMVVTPQFVVDQILGNGRKARTIELEALSARTAYFSNFSIYDLILSAETSLEDDRNQTLSGSGNLRDRTTVWSSTLSKRLSTGTTLQVEFERTLQNSTYRSGSSSSRSPYAVFDQTNFTVTQDLLGNFFGMAERQNNRAAIALLDSSNLEKMEKQEQLVLDSLVLFWDTFVARESFREALSQKEKYEALVREVEKQNTLGISSPGDLPKAKAEFGAQIRNVKSASYEFLKNLELLLTAMRMETDQNVRFGIEETIPALPTMVMPKVEELRMVKVKKAQFESADLARSAVNSIVNFPELKLVAGAGFTGLESTQGKAFSSMASGSRPKYSVALQLGYRLFSDQNSASLNRVYVSSEQAHNDYLQAKENLRQLIGTAMENVRFSHAAAISAAEEMKQWEAAVKAQERSYKQGRLDFSQLIQDYNRYFQSRVNRIRVLGNYHIAVHAYAAAVDDLVK